MKSDAELDLWRTEWQASTETPALAVLRERVARQSRYLRLMLAADILVTVTIGGGTIVLAALDPRPAKVLLAAATWLFIAVAWIFGLANRKDAWSPSAATTAAYLDLSLRRCRSSLRAIKFGAIFYVCEMAFCLAWVFHELAIPMSSFLISTPLLVVYPITIMFAAFLIHYRKQKTADLAYLIKLQNEADQ